MADAEPTEVHAGELSICANCGQLVWKAEGMADWVHAELAGRYARVTCKPESEITSHARARGVTHNQGSDSRGRDIS